MITSPLIHAPPQSSQGQGDDVTDSPSAPPPVHTTFRAFHQPWEVDQTRQMTASCYPALHHHQQPIYYQPIYCTDIVPIKVSACPPVRNLKNTHTKETIMFL